MEVQKNECVFSDAILFLQAGALGVFKLILQASRGAINTEREVHS